MTLGKRGSLPMAVAIAGSLLAALAARAPAQALDPARVLGPQACRDCHKSASMAWERTRHFASRTALDTPAAARIRDALGIRESAEVAAQCAGCHVTAKQEDGRRRVVAGVSCESCHGAAAGWVKVHANYGSGRTKATETPEHRDERLGESMAAGMLRPENLYRVVQNCYACHTVPDEALVNKGGHRAGSPIELVAWSQGAVRHNFGPDGRNAEAPLERRRMIYVLGQMLDLEFAARGLATATIDGDYSRALIARGEAARAQLERIATLVPHQAIRAVIDAGSVRLAVGNGPALLAAAERMSAAAQDFGDEGHFDQLAAVDALLPPASAYKGPVYQP